MRRCLATFFLFSQLAFVGSGCSSPTAKVSSEEEQPKPAILLVTLDTTRADKIGAEDKDADTPALDRLAARGQRFSRALTTAPLTLPAHSSILTGLYPAEHGVHENSRPLSPEHVLLAECLANVGYATAAFVSAFPLDRRFGLARGFDHYDDSLAPSQTERSAAETTDRALAFLSNSRAHPLFLWVHYFDPHDPYQPPAPFLESFADAPYSGEIAAMDRQLGRLVKAFESKFSNHPSRIVVVGDHGEGLGDHGEALHGNLLSQGVMRVPLILAGDGVEAAVIDQPVSTRRIFHSIAAWAGLESDYDLLAPQPEVVLAEALKPYLQYGWQPQVMAVGDSIKVIRSGRTEVYDLDLDSSETNDLSDEIEISPAVLAALDGYQLPTPGTDPSGIVENRETLERLASLGYVAGVTPSELRTDAPNPRDMAFLFQDLDRGSALFVEQQYEAAIQVFERVIAEDPGNLMVAIRLAVAHSVLGREREALDYFERAERIDATSVDRQHYFAMHLLRAGKDAEAAEVFLRVLTSEPNRLPALEALASIRERQGRLGVALDLQQKVGALAESSAVSKKIGDLAMALAETETAIAAFEAALAIEEAAFDRHLELGVCYLSAGRIDEASTALDQVSSAHPGYAMALFKRAQASVLLGEIDWRTRAGRAFEQADAELRTVIAREPLFAGLEFR